MPDVYDAFERYGCKPVRRLFGTGEPVYAGNAHRSRTAGNLGRLLGPDVAGIADRVADSYAGVDGGRLIGMTHERGTPWSTTRHQIGRFFRVRVIPTGTIRRYYMEMGLCTVGR